jgi:hypothetical protein
MYRNISLTVDKKYDWLLVSDRGFESVFGLWLLLDVLGLDVERFRVRFFGCRLIVVPILVALPTDGSKKGFIKNHNMYN